MNSRIKDALRPLLNKRLLDKIHAYNWRKFFKKNLYRPYEFFIKDFSKIQPTSTILDSLNIKNPKIILDIGAHYGEWSFLFSKKYPDSEILSFEPTPRSFKILKKNIRKYMKNALPFNLALGNRDVEAYLDTSNDSGLNHVSKNRTKNKIKIIRLDSFMEKFGLKRIDVIKCDVEGFEMKVFEGAEKSIKKFKPLIICEINPKLYSRYGVQEKNILNFFKSNKYSIYGVGNKLIKTNKITLNYDDYVFIPNKK